MRRHLLPRASAIESSAKIVAVVPARNEVDVVGRSVTSLLNQKLQTPLEIVVVDDASDDGTSEAARTAADAIGCSDRLQIVRSRPLPEGWTGKLWAVSQGVAHAEYARPEYLLLTDADIQHAPETVGQLLHVAETSSFDLVSIMVRLSTDSFAEKLLIPAFVYFFLQLYPPAWVADEMARTAGAAGGCMLIRSDALNAIGGIQSIAGEVIDDCALAGLVKRNQGRVWLGLSNETRSLRSYGGFAGVGKMISRSAFNQLQHSTVLLILTLAGLFATYVFPIALLGSRRKEKVALGVIACSLAGITYEPAVRLYAQPVLMIVTLPLVAVFYAAATVHSAIRYWRGVGGEWKGRIQDLQDSSGRRVV